MKTKKSIKKLFSTTTKKKWGEAIKPHVKHIKITFWNDSINYYYNHLNINHRKTLKWGKLQLFCRSLLYAKKKFIQNNVYLQFFFG